ncbi:Ketosteroid isomerase homolog [Parapedobacter composti]|uniref:Ketosteroid isomerase homolog n=1 Tax=Parapedobacter composti TaxID=623281 RepID=A0A1I1JUU4_9SPHI|nr:nuclear transport factor 2 family protein [Parapedobacter composti]SFC52417.1 Ketosteroid isomerase homolog [Parapedobacter composti]
MKTFYSLITLVGLVACNPQGQEGASTIERTVEAFRQALVDADTAALERLTAASLSYGHSSGIVESKEEFIRTLATGASNFLSIRLSDQQITTSGDVAIVRHQLEAETADAGKDPATIRLQVMTVWQRADGQWKLLARQAVR